jgi:glycine hydroxymethyltransferase
MSDEYREYQTQVLKNSQCLAQYLQDKGWNILTGGTDNHLFLMDLRGTGITGKDAEKALENIGIAVNKNSIPFDTEKPTITSGIRIGTPAVTTRGMKEPEMIKIGEIIDETLCALQKANSSVPDVVEICCRVLKQRDAVKALTDAFPIQI